MTQLCDIGHRSDAALMAEIGRLWELSRDDLKGHWIDLMIKRLLVELNRQLLIVEHEKAESVRADSMKFARVLASLVATFKDLVRFDAQRAPVHERKNKQDARERLEREVNRILAAEEAAAPGEGSQQ